MNTETIICLVIISLVALVMLIIGLYQYRKKDTPVAFYNLAAPPAKEEVSDITAWNKKHGMIWIIYSLCIEAGFWLGYAIPVKALEIIFMIGGVVYPIPFMALRHRSLEKRYKTQ